MHQQAWASNDETPGMEGGVESITSPNASYKDYEWEYPEAMAPPEDEARPPSSGARPPHRLPAIGSPGKQELRKTQSCIQVNRPNQHANSQRRLSHQRRTQTAPARIYQPVTAQKIGYISSIPTISGTHDGFYGKEDMCNPSNRSCMQCFAPAEVPGSGRPRVPVLYVGYGDVLHTIDPNDPSKAALSKVGAAILQQHRIRAVVCISPRFVTKKSFTVTSAVLPSTMHDHEASCWKSGPCEFNYDCPGGPGVARQLRDMLAAAGLPCVEDKKRGLDHACWTALHCLFPADGAQAVPPIIQLSMMQKKNGSVDYDQHVKVGMLLEKLRDDNVLLLGVGNVVSSRRAFDLSFLKEHHMAQFRTTSWPQAHKDRVRFVPRALANYEPWAVEFDNWLSAVLKTTFMRQRVGMVAEYKRHPLAQLAHPEPWDLTSLMVVLGACSSSKGPDCAARKVYGSYQHSISMSSFQFG